MCALIHEILRYAWESYFRAGARSNKSENTVIFRIIGAEAYLSSSLKTDYSEKVFFFLPRLSTRVLSFFLCLSATHSGGGNPSLSDVPVTHDLISLAEKGHVGKAGSGSSGLSDTSGPDTPGDIDDQQRNRTGPVTHKPVGKRSSAPFENRAYRKSDSSAASEQGFSACGDSVLDQDVCIKSNYPFLFLFRTAWKETFPLT